MRSSMPQRSCFGVVILLRFMSKEPTLPRTTARPIEKRDFIAAIDAALGRFLWKNPTVTDGLRVVVSADHGTSCLSGNHIADPVPLLVANWAEEGEPERFDEDSASNGAIGLIRPGELSALLFPDDGVYEATE